MIDFTKFIKDDARKKETNPIELFYTLPKSEKSVGDLWFPQGEALKAWDEQRNKNDVLINLDTGGGKTLLGLLIAQAIVNEGNKRVIYLCSNNQLVSQVKEKAGDYNLKVTTYTGKEKYSDFGYTKGENPLITSYHTLFNGRSVFLNDEIDALIFDDAHTVQNILRGQFTLRIENEEVFEGAYIKICELFSEYYKTVNRDGTFRDIVDGNDDTVLFVPTFVWKFYIDEIKQILFNSDIQDSRNGFAWEFLKDNLDMCSAFISSREIEIAPLLPPTHTIGYFGKKTRRIYLSATLNNMDEFYKTFGKIPDLVIAPTNSAGKCERMILMPKLSPYCDNSFEWVNKAIEGHKTLIITPTKQKAKKWRGLYLQAEEDVTQESINRFKESSDNEKLILTSRYDGIDFPEDTCRCLVVDDLPSGMNLIDKFLHKHLSLVNVLKTAIASRVMQAMGRTTRGVKDFSVVLICGEELEKWLINSKNREAISSFICQQMSLGDLISKDLDSIDKFCDTVNAFFNRDKGWVDTYNHMVKVDSVTRKSNADDESEKQILSIAKAEKEFSSKLWDREYDKAAKILENTLKDAFKFNQKLGHWYEHWIGLCYNLSGNNDAAAKYYKSAGDGERQLGRYINLEIKNAPEDRFIVSEQVRRILELFVADGKISLKAIADFKLKTNNINADASSGNFEQSICELGKYLGYISTRPDNVNGTGPDILWQPPNDDYSWLIFEAKNEKKDGGTIYKKDITKMSDHVNWTKSNYTVKAFYKILLTNCKLMSDKANPDDDIYVIDIDEINSIRNKLVSCIEKLADKGPSEYEKRLLLGLEESMLQWENIFDSCEKVKAIDLPKVST